MKKIFDGIGGFIGLLVLAFLATMLFATAYKDFKDDRPRAGTAECTAAQEAIFKDPIRRTETMNNPAMLLDAVNSACKGGHHDR